MGKKTNLVDAFFPHECGADGEDRRGEVGGVHDDFHEEDAVRFDLWLDGLELWLHAVHFLAERKVLRHVGAQDVRNDGLAQLPHVHLVHAVQKVELGLAQNLKRRAQVMVL